jgi:hypothetical protein
VYMSSIANLFNQLFKSRFRHENFASTLHIRSIPISQKGSGIALIHRPKRFYLMSMATHNKSSCKISKHHYESKTI